MQDEEKLISEFIGIVGSLGLSDVTVAGLCGISPHTVRVTRLGRELPKHARCRRAVVEFVRRNRRARAAAELQSCL